MTGRSATSSTPACRLHTCSKRGQNPYRSPLLAEALLFTSGMAVAAALSFRAAAVAANSITVACLAVLLQVAAYARSYNYPKLLTYALAVAW